MESGGIQFGLGGIAGELKGRLLAVPVYQRSYAWSQDQVQEYWTDLRGAFSDNNTEYFLGTLVITKQADPPRDGIIDGQQRLATSSILLAAIRDEYKSRGDDVRAGIIQKEYLATSDLASAAEVARLSLNSEDLQFFQRRIVDSADAPAPSRQSHERILDAHTYFRVQVAKVADDAGPDWVKRLTDWVEFLKDNVKVIVLEVPSDSDAYLIFETLNDRGADLTIADLLKNYLFGHAGPNLDAVRDGWMMVLGALEIPAENSVFTTFLRHYWSSMRGAVRERELYKSIKQHVATEAQVLDFISNLQVAAELYSALLSDSHDYWDGLGAAVKSNVETLLRLDLEQNRPLLLAVLQHFTDAEKKKLLKALVSWSVRGLVVGGIGGGTAEKAYCNAAVKVRSGAVKTTGELLVELSTIVPSDSSFEDAFKVASVTKANLARYYLIALEKGKRNEAEPEFVPNDNEEQVNLEHVLPKRARAADWGAAFDADERKEYLHRLGNLALLQKGPNGRIGNKSFSDKKVVLSGSGFQLTNEVSAETDWTKRAIGDRQARLAALAVKVWTR
ncbi:MAG: DUF262 domain-containing protein [Coriobacteriia bacterium]|nr:DUF262 domain-containing protein [Coriobacteriia bacterium]